MIISVKNTICVEFDHPLMIRIKSYLNAYGTGYNFAQFWIQYVDGEQTAVISSVDNAVTLVASDGFDENELVDFLYAIGAKSVLSNVSLPLNLTETTDVYMRIAFGSVKVNSQISYRRMFELFDAAFDIGNFEAWYVDICHRIRHSAAYAITTDSAAICGMISDDSSLITGIAVDKREAGKGIGTRLLKDYVDSCGCTKIYALVEDSIADFYIKNGFELDTVVYEYCLERKNENKLF